jgi:UDP-N-acetylglucosamine 1-carboxyvinyltransferase
VKRGYIEAYTKGFKGSHIYLDLPSVGATENLMLSACLSEGKTLIKNASRAPEVVDLARFLRKMGAKIQGEGTSIIRIGGVRKLRPADHSIIPDRIVAGTLVMAIVISRGEAVLEGIRPDHLGIVFTKLREMGAELEVNSDQVRIKGGDYLRSVRIKTLPYPGFPTDLQPQITSLACLAQGTSIVTETIFENRFTHAPELQKMGAKIKQKGARVAVEGIPSLSGNLVRASDIRGGAALVLAGLAAQGTTIIEEIYHIDRGYEELGEDLSRMGANMVRIKE